MPSNRNPVHSLSGYVAVGVIAIGVALLAIGSFALSSRSSSYRPVELAGGLAMIAGATFLAFVYLTGRKNRKTQRRVLTAILVLRIAGSVALAIAALILFLRHSWSLGAFALVLAAVILLLALRWARSAARLKSRPVSQPGPGSPDERQI